MDEEVLEFLEELLHGSSSRLGGRVTTRILNGIGRRSNSRPTGRAEGAGRAGRMARGSRAWSDQGSSVSTPPAARPAWPRAVVALIAVGALARVLLLAFSWNDKLDPDAREYLILARR